MVNKTHGAKKSNLLPRRVTIFFFLRINKLTNLLTNNITNICVKQANVSIPETIDSKKAEIRLKICNYLYMYCMTITMVITEICYTIIINGSYVKTKISHNSETLKPSWDTGHFFPFCHKASTCLT